MDFLRLFYIQLFVFLISTNLFGQESKVLIRGGDISYIPRIEDAGGTYLSDNVTSDPVKIFKQNGMNFFRLRIWHTPSGGYCNLEKTLEMAQRIKDDTTGFILDFHYSDTWADPGHQKIPSAWENLDFKNVVESLYSYTYKVVQALKQQNTIPDIVQLGNEINSGMLWEIGKVGGTFDTETQWNQLTQLLNAGKNAVLDASGDDSLKIMIHLALPENSDGIKWFVDNLNNYGFTFDILGVSYYPWWHGNMSRMQETLNSIANYYDFDILIAETAYPFTLGYNDNTNNIVGNPEWLHDGYPASETGQRNFLKDLFQIVHNIPNNRGVGILYWAPENISAPNQGSVWENCALFDFNGNAVPALKVFREDVTVSVLDNKLIIPGNIKLLQNYPNPFNPSTTIKYEINQSGEISIDIYSLLGTKIKNLYSGIQNAGMHTITWNGKNRFGIDVVSGIYLVKLRFGISYKILKMILLR